MTDILTIDYSLLSPSLSEDEIEVLQQYQSLAQNLHLVRTKLDEINNQITTVYNDEPNADVENLTALSIELQKSLGVLGTMFKSTVHKVLMQVDSNQVVSELENEHLSQQQKNLVNSNKDDKDSEESKQTQHMINENVTGKNDQDGSQQQDYHNLGVEEEVMEGVVDEDDDVDLGSGIDEETMNAVDRIQHELGISADDVDIHRQIADQLEIDNNDY